MQLHSDFYRPAEVWFTVRILLNMFIPSRNTDLYMVQMSEVYMINRVVVVGCRRLSSLSAVISLAVILLAVVVVVVVVVTNHRINGGAHRPEHACARTTPHRFSSEARLLRVAPSG